MEPVLVLLPDGGEVRTYTAPQAARALGVTPKTVVSWVESGGLKGWPPRSDSNPSRSWIVDASVVDRRVEAKSPRSGPPTDVARETNGDPGLGTERQLLEMERAMYQESRLGQLEDDNTRLRDENERLRAQLAALGRVVHELTNAAL